MFLSAWCLTLYRALGLSSAGIESRGACGRNCLPVPQAALIAGTRRPAARARGGAEHVVPIRRADAEAACLVLEVVAHMPLAHHPAEAAVGAGVMQVVVEHVVHQVPGEEPGAEPRRIVTAEREIQLPLAALVFALLYLAFGGDYAPGLGAGFFAGYLGYDMLHYYLHHFRPHGRLGRLLRERHMRHHFQDETCGFGISAPYWDEVFGTSSRPHRGETSPRK